MANIPASVQVYMNKWLEEAGGNVTAEFAWFQNRMKLTCKKCQAHLTVDPPIGTEIDYGIQQFVKDHVHKKPDPRVIPNIVDPVAVTADFKPITKWKSGVEGTKQEYIKKEMVIQQQLKAYKQELDALKKQQQEKNQEMGMGQGVIPVVVNYKFMTGVAWNNSEGTIPSPIVYPVNTTPIPSKAKPLKIVKGRKFR